MSSSEHPTPPVAPAGAARLGSARLRSRRCVALWGLAVVLVLPACNAVLGIDDATLCSDGSCDAGAPRLSEDVAPNLPGRGAGNGDDAGTEGAPGPGGELIPPVQGVNTPGAAGAANSNNGGSGNGSSNEEGTAGAGPASPEPGSGGSNGSGGSSNSGGGSSGGSAGEVPPPPSACEGRESGSAFCDGVTRISCGPGGSVVGSIPCPTLAHCTESSGPACAACLTGEARCTGAILSVCNAAHDGFDTSACAGPAQCNPALARCDLPACAANELRCDGAVLQVCNATLTGFDPVIDCGSPAACNVQTGACNVCAPGTRRCVDGDTVGICDSTGQAETRIDCTPVLESCVAGECELLGL